MNKILRDKGDKDEEIIKNRTLSSKNGTETKVNVEAIGNENNAGAIVFLTSKLVIKNLNLDSFEEELTSKGSILWNILRGILKEINVNKLLDENRLINLINKLENKDTLSEDDKQILNALFNYNGYIEELKRMYDSQIIFSDYTGDKDKLTFEYIKKLVLKLFD